MPTPAAAQPQAPEKPSGLTASQAKSKIEALLGDDIDESAEETSEDIEATEDQDETVDASEESAEEDADLTDEDIPEEDLSDVDVPEDEETDQDDEPTRYTVKVDGKEREVSLDELKAGFRFNAHNTQTAQKNAEERKQLDAAKAEIETKRATIKAYEDRLAQLDEALEEMDGKEPDWTEVKRERPESYAEEYADWQRVAKRKDKLKSERERVAKERSDGEAESFSKTIEREKNALHEKLPVLKDAEKAPVYRENMQKYAESQGFSAKEFYSMVDHRAMVLIDKARRYDAIVSRRDAAKGATRAVDTKKKNLPRPVRPGSSQRRVPANEKARRDAVARARKTGSRTDGQRAIEALLGDD